MRSDKNIASSGNGKPSNQFIEYPQNLHHPGTIQFENCRTEVHDVPNYFKKGCWMDERRFVFHYSRSHTSTEHKPLLSKFLRW